MSKNPGDAILPFAPSCVERELLFICVAMTFSRTH